MEIRLVGTHHFSAEKTQAHWNKQCTSTKSGGRQTRPTRRHALPRQLKVDKEWDRRDRLLAVLSLSVTPPGWPEDVGWSGRGDSWVLLHQTPGWLITKPYSDTTLWYTCNSIVFSWIPYTVLDLRFCLIATIYRRSERSSETKATEFYK